MALLGVEVVRKREGEGEGEGSCTCMRCTGIILP